MQDFKAGVAELPVNIRGLPTASINATYLIGAASGAESFWLADHLN